MARLPTSSANPLNLPTPVSAADVFKVKKREKEEEEARIAAGTVETFSNQQGRASGVTLSDGRTFLGLSPADVDKIARGEAERAERPINSAEAGTAQQLQRELQAKIQTARNIGKIDIATAQQIEEQDISVKEAIAAGIQNVIPSAVGFAAGGAAAGAVGGAAAAGVGAAPGAVAGATVGAVAGTVKGFYSGVTGNIKDQRKDLVTGKTKELARRRTALNNYVSAANANPANADEYVQAFNTELSLIRRDYNTLIKRGDEDLKFWGSDATPQIIDYEVFFESVEPSLRLKMQQAVTKPDPTRAYIDLNEVE